MRALGYAWQEAVASLARARWTLLLSIATIAVAFAMLGAFRVVSGTVERVAGGWSEAAEVSVYLDDVVTEAEQAAIRQVIDRSGVASGVTLVSKEQALARFGAEFPELGDVTASLDANPFPASFEVRLSEAGMAGGADVILVPEIAYDIEKVAAHIMRRDTWGARFSIVVVAEGAKPVGGALTLKTAARPGVVERLGGIGEQVADALQEMTGKESRSVVLGHLQRGGSPTSFDRVLATRFGAKAVELVRRGVFGRMVANNPPDIVHIPLADVVGRTKTVPLDYDLLTAARSIGVSVGD